MPALVEVEAVSKSFGSLRVLDQLSLRVADGEAVGIVGPNGAGKTTLLSIVAGSLKPDDGRVVFEGRNITRLSAHRRCRAGLARTFQIPKPFGEMTVFENVLVASSYGRPSDDRGTDERAAAALEQTGLLPKANARASSLPLLARKQLELARALATGPRVLLLDEIGGGLTELEVNQLVAGILELKNRGLTIVWIEHIVHALVSVVDRLVAIDSGRLLIEGDPETVMASPQVRDVYLGGEAV